MRLETVTSPDVEGCRPVLAVPIGSCEQHGPHLPLGTDTIIATALAERMSKRIPDVLVGPAIGVTASGEHAGFAGTLSIGTHATATMIVELVRSATWTGGVILVNGHGGNADAVDQAVATIRAEGRNVHAWWPTVAGGDSHAGHVETSLMLAIRGDLVRSDLAERGDMRPLAEILPLLRQRGIRAVSRNGVLGDPTAATLSFGTHLFDTLTDDLVASVNDARKTWISP